MLDQNPKGHRPERQRRRKAARQAVLDAIAAAEADGFQVNEDLSVRDTRRIDVATMAARATSQREHAEDIRWHAEQFAQTKALVNKRLTANADELNGIRFDGQGEGPDDTVQMLNDEKPTSPLSEARRKAVEYAERWANDFNPEYTKLGDGGVDCTNFASQVMRAGGFGDVGDGTDDWHRGDSDDWYYNNGPHFIGNEHSTTWTLAKENHNFVTQHSDRGKIVGVTGTGNRPALDPLAPSKAGLVPGDLIYYKDNHGQINHVAVYMGQEVQHGVPTDVIAQHSGDVNLRNDWMPDSGEYLSAPAQAEFVHLRYPGE